VTGVHGTWKYRRWKQEGSTRYRSVKETRNDNLLIQIYENATLSGKEVSRNAGGSWEALGRRVAPGSEGIRNCFARIAISTEFAGHPARDFISERGARKLYADQAMKAKAGRKILERTCRISCAVKGMPSCSMDEAPAAKLHSSAHSRKPSRKDSTKRRAKSPRVAKKRDPHDQ